MEVENWMQNNMSFLVSYPIAVLTLIVGVLLLPGSRTRRALLSTAIIIVIVQVGFIIWVARRQIVHAAGTRHAPSPSPQVKSRPTPSPAPQKPTLELPSSVDQNGPDSSAPSFYLSSKNNPSIRATYCLDGEFEGGSQLGPGTVTIKLNKASFDLCKYSPDSERKAIFQIGIGKREDISKANEKAMLWSKPISAAVTAGVPVDLGPQEVSFKKDSLPKKKNGPVNLSDYGISIRVFNPDRNGKYLLSCENIFSQQ
jgi:hypothetical protein